MASKKKTPVKKAVDNTIKTVGKTVGKTQNVIAESGPKVVSSTISVTKKNAKSFIKESKRLFKVFNDARKSARS